MQSKILVTGACGMIGSRVVQRLLSEGCLVWGIDRVPEGEPREGYTHLQADLGDSEILASLTGDIGLTHIIHLAALAHTAGVEDLSWENYCHVNVTCASNVFRLAAERSTPLLFASTADVYGIADGVVDGSSEKHPIGNYGKSKSLGEDALFDICRGTPYTSMRFAPVYTAELRRDIQKRYYLKYPRIAYRVGKGMEYEVLEMSNLLDAVAGWVEEPTGQHILNVKDPQLMNTADMIKAEKAAGRAGVVIWVPKWVVSAAFKIFRRLMPQGWKTYMLNKVVNPLRTK